VFSFVKMAAPIKTSTYTVRYATQSDVPTILALLRELAEYEKELASCKTSEEMLLATLSFPIDPPTQSSSPSPIEFTKGYARTLLVSPNDSPDNTAGIAVYFPNYSTWTGPGIYIEDMVITSSQRGRGYGTALLSALAREVGGAGGVKGVNEHGMGRLQWSVLKWNKPAIDFFLSDTVGAFVKEEYMGCQVEWEKLVKLAARS
jgi:GNAT superfamily N-acetyltransferase